MTREYPNQRRAINWGWIKLRLRSARSCHHEWAGSDIGNADACLKCGVWRWHPITSRLRRKAERRVQRHLRGPVGAGEHTGGNQ